MRILLWLAITVFISTLFWPQLLNISSVLHCLLFALFLSVLPGVRLLAVIPVVVVYCTLYAHLTLTGSLPIAAPYGNLAFANATALQAVVDGENHNVIVQVNSLINQKNKGYFTAKLIELDGNQLNYSPQIEMRWYRPALSVQAGQKHRFMVRFKPVYGRANPAGFDRQRWRFSEHIAYQANIKAHLGEVSPQISWRAYFYQKVHALSMPLDNQGIILALSFADKTLISLDKKERIQQLAISHLFAISGLHIGLLFSFAYLLLQPVVNRFCPKSYLGWSSWRFINLTALLAAFCYAYLAGFSLPTQRAFLMLLFAVVVLSMKRKCALLDLLTVTLFVILLWDPLAVLSVSLWLSFSAIAIILTILWRFPSISLRHSSPEKVSHCSGIKEYLKFLLLIQVSLTLLMLPLQLVHFAAFSWLSPLINFIAVPLFSLLVIPLILTGCLLSLFAPALAALFLAAADYMISGFFAVFAGGEGAYRIYSSTACQVIMLLISLSLVVFILYCQASSNRKASLLFAAMALLLAGVALWERENKAAEAWFVEALDVGQGLAVLIRSQGQTLLYDSGPRYPSGFTTAEAEIVPYLQSLGVTRLDYLVISHSDIDHAGGFAVIMENIAAKRVILGEPLLHQNSDGVTYPRCKAGQRWSLGALRVEVLAPFAVSKNNNNNSCVLRISDGQQTLLLTGDIDKKQEALLIAKQGRKLASELLFAPHHGSKHSSSEAFIAAVSPQWVIFSAGFMNHWRFPADEVKLRYKNQSVSMVNSGISGFIRFTITKGQIKMQTYRANLAAYWYHHSFSTQALSASTE